MRLPRKYTLILCIIAILGLFQFGCSAKVSAPQVQLNSKIIIKNEIPVGHIIGGVKNIQKSDLAKAEGDEIAVIGQASYFLLSSQNYNVFEYKDYKNKNGEPIYFGLSPQLLDINNDYDLEILLGGGGFGKVGLLDNKGSVKWEFRTNSEIPPRKMIPAVSDHYKEITFYISDYTGLYRLNSNGEIVWHFASTSFSDVSLLNNGAIVGLTRENELMFFNDDGNPQKKIEVTDKINNFEIIKWPSDENFLVENESNVIKIINFKGQIIFQYKIDNFQSYHPPQALTVRFEKTKQPYLVILLHSRSALGVSQLNIISPNGELVYQEIIKSTNGICINNDPESMREVLLVGNGQKGLFEYKMNH